MVYLNLTFISLFLFSIVQKTVAQKYIYKEVPEVKIKTHDLEQDLSGFILISDFLPKNYVKDGTVDYTDVIQNILMQHSKVIFPDFPIAINYEGLTVNNNSILFFQDNSQILLNANEKERYEIIRIHNVSNVKIIAPKLVGDRKKHKGDTGQWGMGIAIRGSKNIEIINPVVRDCWGDGIYIGRLGDDSKSVKIKGGILDNNRRNGLSITSGTDIFVEDIMVSNTNGQNPRSGIDLEPNKIECNLSNISLKNIYTFNNEAYGVVISLHKYYGKSKTIGISIENHQDEFSGYGLSIFEPRTYAEGKDIEGYINLVNPIYDKNKVTPFKYRKHLFGFQLSIQRPIFRTEIAGEYKDKADFFIKKLKINKDSRNKLNIKL